MRPRADRGGRRLPRLGNLDRDSGHGTFIAGIVRQVCPDATVLALRVMPSNGVIDEHQLTIALNKLLVRQAQAQLLGALRTSSTSSPCPSATTTRPGRRALHLVLARTLAVRRCSGSRVVASAGNDSTTTRCSPPALAPPRGAGHPADAVPLTSVGALNPNGTVALFSNGGDWVSCYRLGRRRRQHLARDLRRQPWSPVDARRREASTRDDFMGGFGLWSGTSFAAPVLAAQLGRSDAAGQRSTPSTPQRGAARLGGGHR